MNEKDDGSLITSVSWAVETNEVNRKDNEGCSPLYRGAATELGVVV
jgi:hypothetical protein